MEKAELKNRLDAIHNLPALPMVLQQVQKIMRNPNSNMNQIATVIAKDQALASKTIQLVNSAYYGMSRRVSSITQAIVILGLDTVTNVMLSISVMKIFSDTTTSLSMEKFWEHSFSVALMAKALAEFHEEADPENCFISGLLHDLGRLVLDQYMHEDFVKAMKVNTIKKCSLRRAEIALFGGDHSSVGAYVARRWNLPEFIESAIRFHHKPHLAEQYQHITQIVALADALSHQHSICLSGETQYAPVEYSFLRIPAQRVTAIVEQAKEDVSSAVKQWQM